MVPRGPCRPAQCPSPPTSDAEERVPYCASWVEKVTTKAAGMLLMVLEGCIYKLWSKCSGFVYYDKDTEQISVQDPKFVSSVPQETPYGFLAKVVPTVHTVCVDGQDACQQEIRQELASQVMNLASCGGLVIARAPLCGDVPVQQSGDLAKQVRFDYLDPVDHEDAGCPDMVRFLVSYPGRRGPSNSQVDCQQWSGMYRLKLRGSQWGFIPSGDPLEAGAKPVVVVQVAGGTTENPCFELRVLENQAAGIPEGTKNCQTLRYRGFGTADAGWKLEDDGLLYRPLSAPVTVLNVTAPGTTTVILPQFPTDICGKIVARFQATIAATQGPSGSPTEVGCTIGAYRIAFAGSNGAENYAHSEALITSASVAFLVAKFGSGNITVNVQLLGYEY